ncbi:MAG: flavin reductase family protein [Myxococcales bacterium]|nr:flavin reductase family protein [Myxococcales bacterium]MCB9535906.1 flavin reductase family protein [Myxococcales bacterium]
MRFDPARASSRDTYYTMISTIVPRPIAWVSTVDPAGRPNLAPFSFFMGVTSRPPTLALAIGNKADGGPKDTARNAIDTGELVVNVVPVALAEAMVLTSGEYAHGESEFDLAQVETVPSERVRPPRVAQSPVQFECTVHQVVPLEDAGQVTSRLIIARIELIHVDDAVLDAAGRVDPRRLDPLARLGGSHYATLGDLQRHSRPKV